MGDPKRPKKKYFTPSHPWQKERIEFEKQLMKEYGLMRKKEIWKMQSVAKRFSFRAKKLIADSSEQGKIERERLLKRVVDLGLLPENASLDDVLSLGVKDVLNRRLQTLLVKKGLARTMKQARQMIVHKHVMVNGKVVTSPSYLVSKSEEESIQFVPTSPFADENHPERAIEKKQVEQEKKETLNTQNEDQDNNVFEGDLASDQEQAEEN